jgi:hypothetical protein
MEKKCQLVENNKVRKGVISVQGARLVLVLDEIKEEFVFDKIKDFSDSITNTSEQELEGLSFGFTFRGRKILIYILEKGETEDSFLQFIGEIKGHLEKKEEDFSKYLGSYKSHYDMKLFKSTALWMLVIFVPICSMLGLIIYSEKGIMEGILAFAKFMGYTYGFVVAFLFVIFGIVSKLKIIIRENEIEFVSILGRRVVFLSAVTKFVKYSGRYNFYKLFYLIDGRERTVKFSYQNYESINKILRFLRVKLQHVPQKVKSGWEEKDWRKGQTY